MRVCLFVANDCVTDARVRRHATTLAKAGQEVIVVAVQRGDLPVEEHTEGFIIRRVSEEWRWSDGFPRLFGRATGRSKPVAPRPAGGLPLLAARARRVLRRYTLGPTRFHQIERRMVKEAVRFGADVVIGNDVRTIRAAAACRSTKCRVVYDAHEMNSDAVTLPRWLRKELGLVERMQIKKMDATMTVCEPLSVEFARLYGIPRPLVVRNLPEAGMIQHADRASSPLNEYRRPGGTVIFFPASLAPNRGTVELLHALGHLPEEYSLVIMGHGRQAGRLREIIVANDLGARAWLLEPVPVPEYVRWLAGADVGVLPYPAIGFNVINSLPVKMFEYMHAGVPFVANRALSEARRLVEPTGAGIWIEMNAHALAEAIQGLVSDAKRYEQARRLGLEAAPAFSWEHEQKMFIDLIASLGPVH